MKISERCKKQIEDIEKRANEFKITGDHAPYNIVFWDRDFESITELYLAYKDFEDRCATLEDENENLHSNINHLRQCNGNQYKQIQELKKQLTDITELYHEVNDYVADFEESEDRCATLETENNKLKEKLQELHTIKKSFEVLRALYLGDYEDELPF